MALSQADRELVANLYQRRPAVPVERIADVMGCSTADVYVALRALGLEPDRAPRRATVQRRLFERMRTVIGDGFELLTEVEFTDAELANCGADAAFLDRLQRVFCRLSELSLQGVFQRCG